MIGSMIGPYRITGLLGEGGMGAVYRATDNIEREVAIKSLLSQLTRDESRLKRFRAEAVALGRLHHPNIASLYHLLEQNGDYYMVMEYVEGQTLEDIVRNKGAMTPEMAIAVFNEGLEGFEHAHSRGVIHRDIKPSNLMVSTEGVTKITDFGIARMAGSGRMTQTGKVIGTLEYMSPEQVRGLEQDARSDIYSLGILLFELLTGRMPFTATSDYELMRAHLEEVPPPVRSIVATLPAGLDAIIAKALAKEPAARFQNVAEMRHALEAVARELPTPPPAQTLLTAPEPAIAATRQAEVPAGPAPTSEAQGAGKAYLPPTGLAPSVRPAPTGLPKWAIPAGVGVLAVLLVGGMWAAVGHKAPVDAVPTSAPTAQVIAENQQPTFNPAPTASSGAEVTQPTSTTSSGGDAGIDMGSQVAPPLNLPPTPAGTPLIDLSRPAPDATAPPVTKPTAPSRPAVVAKPPAPRRRERVVSAPPRPRAPRVRVVERPRPRPHPRVRVVERPRPRPRVVSRPTRKHSSGGGGGGEEAALRAIIKGG